MYYQVNGQELPPMRDWSQSLLDEAIDLGIEFGVLILGQGKVTARMIQAERSSKTAQVRVTHDPRNRVSGIEYPSSMKFFHEIRSKSDQFSLVKPANDVLRDRQTRLAARRLLARAKAAGAEQQIQTAKPVRRRPKIAKRKVRGDV